MGVPRSNTHSPWESPEHEYIKNTQKSTLTLPKNLKIGPPEATYSFNTIKHDSPRFPIYRNTILAFWVQSLILGPPGPRIPSYSFKPLSCALWAQGTIPCLHIEPTPLSTGNILVRISGTRTPLSGPQILASRRKVL